MSIWGKISTNFKEDLCLAAYIRQVFAYPTILLDVNGNIINFCQKAQKVFGLKHLEDLNKSQLNITLFIPHLFDYFFPADNTREVDVRRFVKKKALFFTPKNNKHFPEITEANLAQTKEGKL